MVDGSDHPNGSTGPAGVPGDVVLQWRTAQDQLFGSLTSAPEAYEHVVLLVGAATARLREQVASSTELQAVAAQIDRLVVDLAAEHGYDVGPWARLIGPAALALRHREIAGAEAASARAAALAGQRGWVVLEESGSRDGEAYAPYHRLEADADTGLVIDVRATLDEDGARWVHTVGRGQVDLTTGTLRPLDDEPEVRASAAEREARAAELRAQATPPV